MNLRVRLSAISVSTVAAIVTVLAAIHANSLLETWLDTTLERTTAASRLVHGAVLRRIEDQLAASRTPPETLEDAKRFWNNVVILDRGVTQAIEEAMVQSRAIVEINIIGENGKVLASSNQHRIGEQGRSARSLQSVRDLGPIARLSAILNGRDDLETRTPLGIRGQQKPVFEIQVLASPVLMRAAVLPELQSTAIASVFAVLVAGALAVFSANLALRPLERIGEAIDTLATGNPLGLTPVAKDPEVAIVESRLSLLGEQMHGAREAAASLMRGAAHEIKNPLNAMALRLETVRAIVADDAPEVEPEIVKLSAEVARLDRVVKMFLDLGRPVELDIRQFDLRELIDSLVELARPGASAQAVDLQWDRPRQSLTVRADYGLIQQAMLNVVNNAIEAMSHGGRILVSAWRVGLHCEIRISDNGPGIPANVREKIFEPYFTTKEKGSGIGLALTRKTMQLHGGTAAVESEPGKGTTMILSLPVVWSKGS
jgi:signal transduction histidine kinase